MARPISRSLSGYAYYRDCFPGSVKALITASRGPRSNRPHHTCANVTPAAQNRTEANTGGLEGLVRQSSYGLERSHTNHHMADVQRQRELTCCHERTESR